MLSAFPSATRKGQYDVFVFERTQDGTWSFQRSTAKVHVND